jgi:Flp pilus assembly protein CpaB
VLADKARTQNRSREENMNQRTIVIALVAAVAVVAFGSTFWYVTTADNRALKNATVVTVYRVEKPIAKGTTGETAFAQGFIRESGIPQKFKPATAISKETREAMAKKQAAVDLQPGMIVVDGMFQDASIVKAKGADSNNIEPGHVAVSFNFEQVKAVSGFPVPGDLVNMFVVEKLEDEKLGVRTTLAYQNVRIFAVGNEVADSANSGRAEATGTQAAADTYTFSVPVEAAMRMVTFQENDKSDIYLALRAPTTEVETDILASIPPSFDGGSMLNGLAPTPYTQGK